MKKVEFYTDKEKAKRSKKAEETRDYFLNKSNKEVLERANEILEEAYYLLCKTARGIKRSSFTPEEADLLKFTATGAQKVGEIGRILDGIHDYMLDESIKLY